MFFFCVTESSGDLFRAMGNIEDKQVGSLNGNFIAHFERDNVLKLVFLNEEFYCVAAYLFTAALISTLRDALNTI